MLRQKESKEETHRSKRQTSKVERSPREKPEVNIACRVKAALPCDSHFSILVIKTLRLQSVTPQQRMWTGMTSLEKKCIRDVACGGGLGLRSANGASG